MSVGRKITVEFIGKDKSLGSTADKLEGSTSRLGDKFKKFGAMVGAGFAVAGVAGAKFGVDAIKSASDLNETINKSQVIFGKNAEEMKRWAEGSAKWMGMSTNSALSAASSFGDMFKQIGFSGVEAATTSKSVVQLAADLGSFHNLDAADVSDRISAAFRGEYDSLQALIPNINAARVEKEALAATGKKNAEALTAEEKAMAVMAVLNKDGAAAMGDFRRTSGSLANQQKILAAQFENVKAKIGSALLPVATKFINWVNSSAVPMMQKFGEWVGPRLAKAVETIVPLIKDVVSAAEAFWGRFGGFITTSLKDVVTIIKGAFKVIRGIFKTVGALLRGDWKGVWEGVKMILKGAAEVLKGLLRFTFRALAGIVSNGGQLIIAGIKKIPGGIRALGGLFKDAGKWVIGQMVEGLKNAAGVISGIAGNVWNAVKGMLNAGIDRINSALEFTIRIPASPDVHVNPPNIPHLASGTRGFRGGLALVGESGPELVSLSRGADVLNAGATRRMLGGGTVVNLYVQSLDPKAAGKAVVDALVGWQRGTGQVVPVRTR